MKVFLLAACLIAAGFAGCVSKTVVLTRTVDPTEGEYKVGEFPEGTGGLRGVTLNQNGAPVAGVHLTILDQPFYVRSDAQGRFLFGGAIPAGAYYLRWDHSDYLAGEKQIVVVANDIVGVEVVLSAPGGAGEHLQHTHDLWEGRPEITLFSGKVRTPEGAIKKQDPSKGTTLCTGVLSSQSSEQPCHTAPFRLSPPTIVPPGTKELRLTLTWAPADFVREAEFRYTAADQTNYREVKEIAQGEVIKIPLLPTNPDHGHSTRSMWTFAVVMRPTVAGQPSGGLHTEPTNEFMAPEATVTLVAVKGDDLPAEPGHPRYWQHGSEIVLLNDANGVNQTATRDPTAPNGAMACTGYAQMCRVITKKIGLNPGNVTIVPPGTTRLRMEFEWGTHADSVPPTAREKVLLVRTANVDPFRATWDSYVTPTVIKTEGRKITYELKLKPNEVDPFYAKKSGFTFAFTRAGEERESRYVADCPNPRPVNMTLGGCAGDRFRLIVTAINDDWTPAYLLENKEDD